MKIREIKVANGGYKVCEVNVRLLPTGPPVVLITARYFQMVYHARRFLVDPQCHWWNPHQTQSQKCLVTKTQWFTSK